MPELPEVETVRRGIEPWILQREIIRMELRVAKLRQPLQQELVQKPVGQTVRAVQRRGKYLLLRCDRGSLILHLGMSGFLRVLQKPVPAGRHDHADICFFGGICLRLNDVRKFSTLIWTSDDPLTHPLLADHGPEPLSEALSGDYLYRCSRNRRLAVKSFIMDHRIVVGIGNIYANEALFRTGIHPALPAGDVSLDRYRMLAANIREVLEEAIAAGGTTLHDFSDEEGHPGYFSLQLNVYGRAGQPCTVCGTPVESSRIGQRSSFYCRHCQH
ncbi:MAG: bifunctional DNA-formamidopyrimidine glycosylase/DNA-(apurinic or apyrimidinic site) lyase [Deltaproteobacteria bacterium]|nr:bifunctional DNA-formamidopyrimidine glycosylase/DNA-(apurinic or apyrimidinic site) lyase [Deltaproteobacteria bacterium]TLN04036.1 MAG: bifunctional DNA-formamidopyrimidine glycosylase/DNA-(apurinic or apyrimidinic site) lyase [bacterium]